MKNAIIIASAAFLLSIFTTGCNDNDGNTGNGANDPTATFEPNNLKDGEDARLQKGTDSTTATTVDTTVKENRH